MRLSITKVLKQLHFIQIFYAREKAKKSFYEYKGEIWSKKIIVPVWLGIQEYGKGCL